MELLLVRITGRTHHEELYSMMDSVTHSCRAAVLSRRGADAFDVANGAPDIRTSPHSCAFNNLQS
jgi:hypothetical protein